jgi:thiol-disulfide isomerase/thioredoxin
MFQDQNQWEKKYLKYKKKYLSLKNKNMIGGFDKPKIVLFKADWCGHCKMFMPVWTKLQEDYKRTIKFITYDSEVHKDQINKMNVQGYPTIHILQNGGREEYIGERTYEGLEEKIKKIIN